MLRNHDEIERMALHERRNEKLKKVDKTKPLIDVCFGYGKEYTWSKMTEEEYEIRSEYIRELNQLK